MSTRSGSSPDLAESRMPEHTRFRLLAFIAALPISLTSVTLIGLRKPVAHVAPVGWALAALLP